MTDIVERVTEQQAAQHNIGYERIVLGCLLGSPASVAEVQEVGLDPGDFYKPSHGTLYAAICEASVAGRPTEPVALAGQLAAAGSLTQVGGPVYLAELFAAAVPGQAGWYARALRDLADRRRVLIAVAQVGQAALGGADADRLASVAEEVIQAARPRGNDVGMVSLGEFAQIGIRDIEMRKGAAPGLRTGLADLDALLGGLRPGQLVVIAGRTGSGKSTLAMDWARQVSIRDHLVTAYFSMEMPIQELFDRSLSAESGVQYERVRDGELDEWDWQRASSALGPMAEAPLFIDDSPGQTLVRIGNKSRKLQARHGLHMVVIDHVGLVTTSGRWESRNQEQAANIRKTKELAGDLGVPVVALAQENRNADQRADKTPQLTDIRDSGEIEQSADIVIMVHRDDYYDPESPRAGEADFYVKKNRRGRQDVVTAAAQLHVCRFMNMAVID